MRVSRLAAAQRSTQVRRCRGGCAISMLRPSMPPYSNGTSQARASSFRKVLSRTRRDGLLDKLALISLSGDKLRPVLLITFVRKPKCFAEPAKSRPLFRANRASAPVGTLRHCNFIALSACSGFPSLHANLNLTDPRVARKRCAFECERCHLCNERNAAPGGKPDRQDQETLS
jgi:hypothetical protein